MKPKSEMNNVLALSLTLQLRVGTAVENRWLCQCLKRLSAVIIIIIKKMLLWLTCSSWSPMTLSSQLESSVWWQTVTWRVTCDYVSVCSVCVLAPGHPAHLSLDSHLHVSFMQFLGRVFVSVCEQTKTVSPKVCHSTRYANWEYTFKSGQKRCSYVDTFSLVQVDGEVWYYGWLNWPKVFPLLSLVVPIFHNFCCT